MSIKLGIVMDSIQSVKIKHDTTFGLMLEAQKRGWSLYYMEQHDLLLKDGVPHARMQELNVFNNEQKWFECTEAAVRPLKDLDVIFMRKDPPVDMNYIYATHILSLAEKLGVLVINKPQSLRDYNEKLIISEFPQCTPPTVVSASAAYLKQFWKEQGEVIAKPLDGMGGQSIFRLGKNDLNFNVVIETLTKNGRQPMMMQRFIPEINQGDKRILIIDGEPVPHALVRVPEEGEARANMAVGGRVHSAALSKRDYWICEQLKSFLKEKQLFFVGLDVIGDYLTEVNITSPTCMRELESLASIDIAKQVLDGVEKARR